MSSHRNRTSRLGVKTGHRTAMIRNLTLGLVEHGRIKTTVARAKRLRPFVERLVTRLKDPTVANLRLATAALNNRDAVLVIAKEIAPKFATRPGGYTRILKLAGARAGDAADMALIEWVEESLVGAYSEEKTAKKAPAKKGAKAKAGKAKAAKAEKTEKKAKTAKSE
jgi:large subunit ribosomal protein L17